METQAMIAIVLCFGVGLILVIQGVDTRGKRDQGSGPSEKKPLNEDESSKQKYEGDTSRKPASSQTTFPVFVARSSSYMDAISIATGVYFAIKWDAESEDIEFKPAEEKQAWTRII